VVHFHGHEFRTNPADPALQAKREETQKKEGSHSASKKRKAKEDKEGDVRLRWLLLV
jgi:hypothetical protein